MIKKRITYLLLIILTNICYGYDFKTNKNCTYINSSKRNERTFQKDQIIDIDSFYTFASSEDPYYYAYFEEDLIYIDYLDKINSTSSFSKDFLASCKNSNVFLYPYYVVESVKNNDRNIIANNDKKNTIIMTSIESEFEEVWYQYTISPQLISNIGLVLGSTYGTTDFFIKNITKKNDITFEIVAIASVNTYLSRLTNPVFPDIKNNEEVILKLIKDGDYLQVYINNETKPREIYCYVNNDFRLAINQLVKNNKCNNSNLTWPCHADGTCDYDDSSKSSKTAVPTGSTTTTPSTNVSVNKTMTAFENLKLRSAEATSSSVITVMSSGTKVKVLQLGKPEKIDGINSNWVKVEVQKGAKDRNGKEIKEGTVGWCYGGYLK